MYLFLVRIALTSLRVLKLNLNIDIIKTSIIWCTRFLKLKLHMWRITIIYQQNIHHLCLRIKKSPWVNLWHKVIQKIVIIILSDFSMTINSKVMICLKDILGDMNVLWMLMKVNSTLLFPFKASCSKKDLRWFNEIAM